MAVSHAFVPNLERFGASKAVRTSSEGASKKGAGAPELRESNLPNGVENRKKTGLESVFEHLLFLNFIY